MTSTMHILRLSILCVIIVIPFTIPLSATTHYVSLDGGHVSPFTSWATAATNIQDAVDEALEGDLVIVSNGVYKIGTRVTPGYVSLNRLVITNDITVQSVNGPKVTIIQGQGPLGNDAVRGVYMTAGTLIGFTISNGHTRVAGHLIYDRSGGGVNMFEGSASITNCIVYGNSADQKGGGVFWGTVNNCTITGNTADQDGGGVAYSTINNSIVSENSASEVGGGVIGRFFERVNNSMIISNSASIGGGVAWVIVNNSVISGNRADRWGGGVYGDVANNCTIIGNSADSGGGVFWVTVNNSIVWNNTADSDSNYYGSTLQYSCTTPLPDGTGNISDDPQFVDEVHGNYRLKMTSPCINAGTNAMAPLPYDLDGNPRIFLGTVDMGAYEFWADFITITNHPVTVSHHVSTYTIGGSNDVNVVDMWWTNSLTGGSGSITPDAQWWSAYDIPLRYGENVITVYGSNLYGIVTSDNVTITREFLSATRYVSPNGSHVSPFTSWATAATNIQDAVDEAVEGNIVFVSNGVYATGSRVTPGYAAMNRLVITNNITVQSINGPEVTVIKGTGPLGHAAVRGVYMSAGVLSGFSITNGHTRTSGIPAYDTRGGGINMYGGSGSMSNCIVVGNSANSGGGGVYGGTVNDSVISGNRNGAYGGGGGVYQSVINNSVINRNTSEDFGGGVAHSTVNNSVISGNNASNGGGVAGGTVNNSTIFSNSVLFSGGGVAGGTINNSLISSNSAGHSGGGTYGSTNNNSVLVGNSAPYGGGVRSCTVNNSTIIANNASQMCGGAFWSTVNNSIVWNNKAPSSPNHHGSTLQYSCTTPLPDGPGNISDDPQFIDEVHGNYRLKMTSPCINAGTNAFAPMPYDLDGNPRILLDTVDMGAYEFSPIHIHTNALIFPAAHSMLQVGFVTSVVWRTDLIHDEIDGTNLVITGMAVHPYDDVETTSAVITNNVSNLAGSVLWHVPTELVDDTQTYVLSFEIANSSHFTNSFVFHDNPFTVVPEPGIVGVILLGVLCAWRKLK